MRALPSDVARQLGVFTTQQAIADGWSQDALDRAVTAGRLRRLRRGAFAVPLAGSAHELRRRTLLQDAIGASLLVPGSVITHAAAAVAHDVPLLMIPDQVCLTVPAGSQSRQPGLHLHRRGLPTSLRLGNLRVAGLVQTCLDIAVEHGVAAGVVAADAALREGRMTPAELRTAVESASLKGRVRAIELCEMANGLSESPLESLSRLALAGFEVAPALQTEIFGRSGRFIGRVDFCWPELGVVGEADGAQKYGGVGREPSHAESLRSEKRRQDELTAHNLVVVRWGWREACEPTALQLMIRRGFAQASLLRAAGVVPEVRYQLARPVG